MNVTEITSGLLVPEGPVAMTDGSVIVVEAARGTLSRVTPEDNKIEVVAELGGGPNGAALGPDGAIYVCNNGGGIDWTHMPCCAEIKTPFADYSGGRIERVDLATGSSEVLYSDCNGIALNRPNDLVFDAKGGFYFTDTGRSHNRKLDEGAVFYARADGSMIKELIFPMVTPNGIGLSADEKTLYVTESYTARLWAFHLSSPGEISQQPGSDSFSSNGLCLAGAGGYQIFDSLALDAQGNICVGTLINGGITSITADGKSLQHYPMDDHLTTNIAFGGEGLKTAYITLTTTGRLVSAIWPVAGQPLNFLNQ